MTIGNIKPITNKPDDNIDLIALAKTFWKGRALVFKSVFVFGLLGLYFALFSSKEYVAYTIMVPANNDASKLGGMGSLGGLAAMAGISINSTTGGDLSPIVYPQIVSSLPFQLELMGTQLNFKELKSPVTLFEYFTEYRKPNLFLKYTLGLPALIIKTIKGEELKKAEDNSVKKLLELSDKQKGVQLLLSQLVSLEVNAKDGLLTLSAKMPEALAAAQLGQRAQELLQRYITEFKTKKATSNLLFIQQRYDETASKFEVVQQRLAMFRDKNKNVSLATAKTEEERLSSQYNLVYGIYSELAKQLEQAKIQVKQDTPVLTVIQPIFVPTKRSKPNRPLILLNWLFIGGVIGTATVFGKGYLNTLKKQWNEK